MFHKKCEGGIKKKFPGPLENINSGTSIGAHFIFSREEATLAPLRYNV